MTAGHKNGDDAAQVQQVGAHSKYAKVSVDTVSNTISVAAEYIANARQTVCL